MNLSIADNGKFLPNFSQLHRSAKEKLIDAKRDESVQTNVSSGTDTEALYRKYEEAWIAYDKLDEYLKKSEQAIAFASSYSKKSDMINKSSLVIGVVGMIVGFLSWVF